MFQQKPVHNFDINFVSTKLLTTLIFLIHRFMWGVPGYCPPRAIGEDDTSLQNHRKTVVEQGRLSERSRNTFKCATAMRQLFPERRHEITSGELKGVVAIREKYPLLFVKDAVSIILA